MQSFAPSRSIARPRGRPQGGASPRIHPLTVSLSHEERAAVSARAAALGKKPAVYLHDLVVADLARGGEG